MRHPRIAIVVLALLAAGLAVARPAEASDSRGAAGSDMLEYGTPVSVNTAGYDVEADEPGTTLGITCGISDPVRVDNTAWFRLRGTGGPIGLTTAGSSYDTVVAVYRSGTSTPVICNDDPSTTDLQAEIAGFRTSLGTTYEVQVGAACPPVGACNAGILHLLATRPKLSSQTSMSVRLHRSYTKVSRLTVSGAPKGSRVTVGCTGCGRFTHKAVKMPSTPLQLGYLLKGLHLKAGAKVAVAVTRPGYVGNLAVFAFRSHRKPTKQTFCLEPGSSKPQTSCG